jgi:hypothetical protein
MARQHSYEPVLSGKASSFLVGLSKVKQRSVIMLAHQLAEHPGQLGDYVTEDETGRKVQHLLVGDWHFSFWPDHAIRELRITEINEL